MTSVLKSDSTKNGIILKEVAKKFEEATSTSGCDLEMSEITSSMPNSLSILTIDTCASVVSDAQVTVSSDNVEENVKYVKVRDEVTSDIEDVIDGFSVFSFVTEEDLIKFSIKNEKIDAITELENIKSKKSIKNKKQNKFNKSTKELSCTEDGIDIYDFQANSESSPSSKNSSVNFKKTLNKKFSSKYIKKFKHKFKSENNLSPSEENSSGASVTDLHTDLLLVGGVDGNRNESPRPTSNDDNNVVSTTTPDNGNIKLDKSDLDKIQASSLRSPLKNAALRLYKLEDELTSSSLSMTMETKVDETRTDQQVFSIGSDNVKVYSNQNQISCTDEKYQQKIVPTKFSVDLLTKITEKQTIIDDTNKCLSNATKNFENWNITRKSPNSEVCDSVQNSSSGVSKHIISDITVSHCNSHHNTNKMSATTSVKPSILGNTPSYKGGSINSNGSCSGDVRSILGNDNDLVIIDVDNANINNNNNNNSNSINSNKTNNKSSTNSPMQSWLELHAKGLLYQQHNASSNSAIQNNSSASKSVTNSSFNPLTISSHTNHINNNNNSKTQHDSTLLDWKNNYFDNSKMLANSVPKFSQNLNSLSHELVNNIRYQQEQQELMNALKIKHENSKIPKPLVHIGLDSMYKIDHSSYKAPESRFQTPQLHNYFMPNSQLPTEFNTANVFKTRSDTRCHQNQLDHTSGKDSFSKTLSSLASSNFKTPETMKRRGQWCDMHVKIAYFIYRSQRRVNMLKSQELNSQLSHLMYSQKMPPISPALPTGSPYSSSYLPHSSPYLDYRPSQVKPDHPGYLNYQSKSASTATPSAFLTNPLRPLNPYHSLLQQGIDQDLTSYEDQHQTPEQKWLRLLSHYMTNHPLSSSSSSSSASMERPNPEILNQLYLWYQQIAQTTNSVPHFSATQTQDPNAAYLRKYMEHLSCLGSMKPDTATNYLSNSSSMTERDMQLYLLKQQQQQQQQYQKALISKYQSAAAAAVSNKSSTINHVNPLLINSPNPFYNKKLLDLNKSANNGDPLLQQYRMAHDQMRQIKQESLSNHHSRNGFSKLPPESGNPKRRKLNSESLKNDMVDKDDVKSITDLTIDYVSVASTLSNNNNNNNSSHCNINFESKISSKPRENINFHLQTVIPDTKE